jgi:hypothetical protein
MSEAETTHMQPDPVVAYCGTCRAEKPTGRSEPIPAKYIGMRVHCPVKDGRKHWAKLLSGPVQKFWLEIEADFVRYETRRGLLSSPMRWFSLTNRKAGRYVTVRFLLLVLILVCTAWMPELLGGVGPVLGWLLLTVFSTVIATRLVLDILIINTSTAFVTRNPKDPLRSAILLICGFGQIAIAYAVFYSLLVAGFNFTNLQSTLKGDPLHALYFSVITLATLGYGDITPLHFSQGPAARYEEFLSEFLIMSEIFCGVYFLALLVTTILSLLSNDRPDHQEHTLAEIRDFPG